MKQEPISCRADNALAARCQSFAARWACVLKRSIFYLAAYIDNNNKYLLLLHSFSSFGDKIEFFSRDRRYQWLERLGANYKLKLSKNIERPHWSLPRFLMSGETRITMPYLHVCRKIGRTSRLTSRLLVDHHSFLRPRHSCKSHWQKFLSEQKI